MVEPSNNGACARARFPEVPTSIDPRSNRPWFSRLLPVVLADRVTLVMIAVAMVIGIGAQVSVPALAREAIDLTAAGDRSALVRVVMVLGSVGLVRMAASGTYRYLLFRTAYRLDTSLRMLIYRHLTTLSFSFYDRSQSGDIISRANSDIRSIQLLLAFAPLFVTSLAIFAVALIVMVTIHLPLTLVALTTLPGVLLLGNRMRNRVFPLSWVTQARTADLAMIVDENINGVRVVRSFAAEQRELNKLAEAAAALRWSATETIRQRGRYNPLIEALPRLSTAMVLLYGGWLAIEGHITIGTLFAFNAYVLMLQVPFRMGGFILLQAQRARASSQRIFEILDEQPTIVGGAVDLVASGDDPTASVRGRIEFGKVDFSYGSSGDERPAASSETDGRPEAQSSELDRRPILRACSFHVEAGETVAIVGRTGSGKSTIARLLGRFYDPSGGMITIDGHRLEDLTLNSLRQSVGMVLDDSFLFSASLHDNIAYGRPEASRSEVTAAAKAAQAHEFIDALASGYDTVIGERGYTLSGGQRQRVCLARALVYDPPILILDDATSAVDVHVESLIHEALTDALGTRTTIVIAHRLSTIALASRVLVLDDGHIVANGTHQHLLATEPRYREILASIDRDDTSMTAEARK